MMLDWDGYPVKNCEALFRVQQPEKIRTWLESRNDVVFVDKEKDQWVYQLLQKGESELQPVPNLVNYEVEGVRIVKGGTEIIDLETKSRCRIIANFELSHAELKIFSGSEGRFDYALSLLRAQFPNELENISEHRLELCETRDENQSLREPKNEISQVKRKLAESFIKDYYRKWVDEVVPALDNMTPRQALQHSTGREKLKELLKDIIQMEHQNDQGAPALRWVFDALKIQPEDLGLKM